MKTKIKKLPHSKMEVEVEVPARDFEAFYEKAITKAGQELEVPGFRKGKVPRGLVLKEVNQESLLMEAAKMTVEASYKKIVRESRLEPISQPKITILKLPILHQTRSGTGTLKNPFCFKGSFFMTFASRSQFLSYTLTLCSMKSNVATPSVPVTFSIRTFWGGNQLVSTIPIPPQVNLSINVAWSSN